MGAILSIVILMTLSVSGCIFNGGDDPSNAEEYLEALADANDEWYVIKGLKVSVTVEGDQKVIERHPNSDSNNVTGEYTLTVSIDHAPRASAQKEGDDEDVAKKLPFVPPQGCNDAYWTEFSPIDTGETMGDGTPIQQSKIFSGLQLAYNQSAIPGNWLTTPNRKLEYDSNGTAREIWDLDNYDLVYPDGDVRSGEAVKVAKPPTDRRGLGDLVTNGVKRMFIEMVSNGISEVSKHQYQYGAIFVHVSIKNPFETSQIIADYKVPLFFPIHVPFDPEEGNTHWEVTDEYSLDIHIPFKDVAEQFFAVNVQGSKSDFKCYTWVARHTLLDYVRGGANVGAIFGILIGIALIVSGVFTFGTTTAVGVIMLACILGCLAGGLVGFIAYHYSTPVPPDFEDIGLVFLANADKVVPYGEEVVLVE